MINSQKLNHLTSELLQFNREQMAYDKKYSSIHLTIEERRIEMQEKESTIKMEKLERKGVSECCIGSYQV